MYDLSGKVALVTGSAKGIGAGIVRAFAQAKAHVVINYRSEGTYELSLQLQKEAKSYGVEAMVVQCDVSNFIAVGEMIEDIIAQMGKIDIVVNNAGITRDGLSMRMKEEDFDQVIEANLKSAFNVSRQVLPKMIKQKSGNIINMSSVVGLSGNAGQANYAASKAGMIGLTKSLAKEVAARNIRVNAIAPGFISSDMTDKLSEEQRAKILNYIPLKQMGKVEDVAKATLFLASEMSSYMTGQVLSVDGGMHI